MIFVDSSTYYTHKNLSKLQILFTMSNIISNFYIFVYDYFKDILIYPFKIISN